MFHAHLTNSIINTIRRYSLSYFWFAKAPVPALKKRLELAGPLQPIVSVKGRRGVKLELVISFMDDHRKLPVVELRKAA